MSYQNQRPPQGYPGYPPAGYGPWGPPPPPRREWYQKKRWWLAFAALGLAVIVVAGAAGAAKDDPPPAPAADQPAGPGADPAATTPSAGPEVYAIGQTAHTGDFDVTVHTLTDPWTSTNSFERPGDGQRFVAVEATITNTSTQPRPFGTLLATELVDQLDRAWHPTVAGVELPQLGAPTIGPGEARRGWVVFELPPDATQLRLRVKGNLTATGSLFALN